VNGLARELFDWVTGNGYGEPAGDTGGGHIKYRLRNGVIYYAARTPSHYTAVANAQADIRRMLGVRSESPRAARYRHKPTDGYDGRPLPGAGWPPEVRELRAQVDLLDQKLLGLDPNRQAKEIRKATARRRAVAEELNHYGVLVPPLHR
jgi:hypothetical protein